MYLHKHSAKYWPAPACEDTVSGQGKNHMEELEGTTLSTLTGPGVVSAPIGQSATPPHAWGIRRGLSPLWGKIGLRLSAPLKNPKESKFSKKNYRSK